MIVAEFILKLMTGLLPTEEAQYACVPTGSPPVVAGGRSSWLSYKQMAITVAGVCSRYIHTPTVGALLSQEEGRFSDARNSAFY